MKTIRHKTNGITINGNGINSSQNTIVYSMIIPLTGTTVGYSTPIEYAISAFPYINGIVRLDGINFIYGDNKHIPNLPDILDTNFVEQSDVGLSGSQITKNFSTAILYGTNALELVLTDWDLIIV